MEGFLEEVAASWAQAGGCGQFCISRQQGGLEGSFNYEIVAPKSKGPRGDTFLSSRGWSPFLLSLPARTVRPEGLVWGGSEGWRGDQQFRKDIKVVIFTFSSNPEVNPMFWTLLGRRGIHGRLRVIDTSTGKF